MGRTHDSPRIPSLCAQLPRAQPPEACSESSHNPQAAPVGFGLEPPDCWKLLLPPMCKTPFPFLIPGLAVKKIN